MVYEIRIINTGYYFLSDADKHEAKCTCTLIKGKFNVIVNTMTTWDRNIVLNGLENAGLGVQNIDYVISTNGGSSYTGNNNLFIHSKHVIGQSLQMVDMYLPHQLSEGKPLKIDHDDLQVVPTPGRTLNDVSVLVKTAKGIVAIVGDLFIKEDDIENDACWLATRSENPILQRYNRCAIINMAYMIIPGYGVQFEVTEQMRRALYKKKAPFTIDLQLLSSVGIP